MRRWITWVNVMLGVWLVAAPWLFYVTERNRAADWSSWSVGAGVVALAMITMRKRALWNDAIGVALGAWLIVSPWFLGSAGTVAANAVIVGLLLAGYALWAARMDRTQDAMRPPRAMMHALREP